MNLFARTIRYEDRAYNAIKDAVPRWERVEELIELIEWVILRDGTFGKLVNETGIRGFVYPGARSIGEPDIDVLYEDGDTIVIIHDLTFRDAKANYAGHA